MTRKDIELCASYWTVGGQTWPGAPDERSPFPLRDRAETCGRIGWRAMGFVMEDIEHSIATLGLPTVRALFEDNGIRHVELEFLVDWHLDGARRAASGVMFDRMLERASQLPVPKIKLGGGVFETGAPDLAAMRDAMAGLCERAAPLGIDLVVEFLPFASINTIARGIALFDGLGVSNGGLLVDTWHVTRGGMSAEDIRQIPPAMLKAVELDDAGAVMQGDLFNDSTHHRHLCGEGAIDIPAQLQAILDSGYQGYFGVEVISAAHRALPLEVAAQRAFDTTMAQFERVTFPAATAA